MGEISFKIQFIPARRLLLLPPRSLPTCINGRVWCVSVTWVRAAFLSFLHNDQLRNVPWQSRWMKVFFKNTDGRIPFHCSSILIGASMWTVCSLAGKKNFKYYTSKIELFLKKAFRFLRGIICGCIVKLSSNSYLLTLLQRHKIF